MRSPSRALFVSSSAIVVAMALVLLACSSFGTDDTAPPPGAEGGDTGAGNDGAGLGLPFCETASALCADFDDPMRDVWDSIVIHDGGTLVVSSGALVSPPSALHATVQPPPAGVDAGCRSAVRYRELDAAAPKGLKLEYAILPGGTGGTFPGNIATGPSIKTTDSAGQSCEYYLNASDSVAYLVVEPSEGAGGGASRSKLLSKLAGGTWNAVTIELTGGAGAMRMVTVSVGGAVALQPIPVPEYCKNAVVATELQVGLFCVGDDTPSNVEAWFDNVRVTPTR